MSSDHIPVFIFLAPFLAALLVPFAGASRRFAQVFSIVSVTLSLLLSLRGLGVLRDAPQALSYRLGGWAPPFGIEWYFDGFSALFCLLISVIAVIVLISTGKTVDREIGRSYISYYTLTLLHLSGLYGIVLTRDFFNLFVFIEVASLTGYALIASGDKKRGNVASFRYLLIGSVGASLYLLGVGYLYATTGTLNMADMFSRLPSFAESKSTFVGIFLIFTGLIIKSGLFPFHGWLPDAYTHSADSLTSLIAPLMTKVCIYANIRILFWAIPDTFLTYARVFEIMIGLGFIAMIAGSIMAFVQSNFKRMLAYSSISQIGLIIMAFGLRNDTAFLGASLHIINHAAMKACLFLVAASAFYKHGIKNIEDFAELRQRMPFSLTAFLIASLSMIGIPPTCGFFSKWYIALGAIKAGFPALAFAILLSSLLTALYFFKVIEKTFFSPLQRQRKISEAPLSLNMGTGILSLSLFLLAILAPIIYEWGLKTVTLELF